MTELIAIIKKAQGSYCSDKNDLEKIKKLVESATEQELNTVEKDTGRTAFHYVCMRGSIEFIELFFQENVIEKIDFEIFDNQGLAPLHYYFYSGIYSYPEIVLRKFLEYNKIRDCGFSWQTRHPNPDRVTPLHYLVGNILKDVQSTDQKSLFLSYLEEIITHSEINLKVPNGAGHTILEKTATKFHKTMEEVNSYNSDLNKIKTFGLKIPDDYLEKTFSLLWKVERAYPKDESEFLIYKIDDNLENTLKFPPIVSICIGYHMLFDKFPFFDNKENIIHSLNSFKKFFNQNSFSEQHVNFFRADYSEFYEKFNGFRITLKTSHVDGELEKAIINLQSYALKSAYTEILALHLAEYCYQQGSSIKNCLTAWESAFIYDENKFFKVINSLSADIYKSVKNQVISSADKKLLANFELYKVSNNKRSYLKPEAHVTREEQVSLNPEAEQPINEKTPLKAAPVANFGTFSSISPR